MATIDQSSCPKCGAGPGTLTLSKGMQALPIGTWSLAGVQLKTSAIEVPVVDCSACGLHVVGSYDPDGRHVTFPNPDEPALNEEN
jgi:hypothetical protein